MIELDIVCPIYKGFSYLNSLYDSFFYQKNIKINKIVFPITNSKDEEFKKIMEFVKEKTITYFIVEKEEFSHSLTREKAIIEYCNSDIVVMLSQDIKLIDEYCFYNLTKSIYKKETVYNYARQICSNNTIEKYIREKNYPKESYVVSKSEVDKMQLMAFFASDACSAYDRNIFIKVGGYGNYDVMMNEDQLYSKIILDAGYKKKYCADAVVEHSHKYTLKQLYERYYQTGKFYKEVKIFDNYNSTESGFKLAKSVLFKALRHFNLPVLIRWLPDMLARYLGMRKGRKEVIK